MEMLNFVVEKFLFPLLVGLILLYVEKSNRK